MEEILGTPEKLRDLDLDAFAEELERQVCGKGERCRREGCRGRGRGVCGGECSCVNVCVCTSAT